LPTHSPPRFFGNETGNDTTDFGNAIGNETRNWLLAEQLRRIGLAGRIMAASRSNDDYFSKQNQSIRNTAPVRDVAFVLVSSFPPYSRFCTPQVFTAPSLASAGLLNLFRYILF